VFAQYAGSASCLECHEDAHQLWQVSNHRYAERPIHLDMDRSAFDPPRTFHHASQSTEVRLRDGRCEVVTLGLNGRREAWPADRVIGHHPLRQFLVPAPGGRWQTLEASYDPVTNEWFNVYGEEDRQPGEWGHWTGRGMNWNQMCATCHNTRLRKNYDVVNDTYRTTMAELSVGCEACHGPLKTHGEWRKEHPDPLEPDPTLAPIPPAAMRDTCGACHARRGELTGDFRPGDSFFDHFSLVIVNETDTFYPDGQVRDEDYEFAPFLGSRMHQGGVTCTDCHDPHSMKTRLPGNWLCMRCHNGSVTNAPLIQPVAHSQHRVFGYDTNGVPAAVDLLDYLPGRFPETGGECVNCHMPQTVYMQRHSRHDHGFTIPDPLLTRQFGIPNACNRCHTDKDVAWSIDAVDRWYGPKMDRPSRHRAIAIALARQGADTGRDSLLRRLPEEPLPYWQAAVISLLARWVDDPRVADTLIAQLRNPHPLPREMAASALGPLVSAGRADLLRALQRALEDPSRNVRVAAGWALRHALDPDTVAGREVRHFLDLNADQPTGQLQLAVWQLSRQQPEGAAQHLSRAIAWDPNSAPLRHEYAIVLSQLGRSREAVAELEVAARLEPAVGEYPFKLALGWNEIGDLPKAVAALEEALRRDPGHSRAWYNLGLARDALGQPEGALEALVRAESLNLRDPQLPYARATVLGRQGRTAEARDAARRALEIDPGFAPARQLLDHLR